MPVFVGLPIELLAELLLELLAVPRLPIELLAELLLELLPVPLFCVGCWLCAAGC